MSDEQGQVLGEDGEGRAPELLLPPGGGAAQEFAFSDKVAIPGGDIWESTIRKARDARLAR